MDDDDDDEDDKDEDEIMEETGDESIQPPKSVEKSVSELIKLPCLVVRFELIHLKNIPLFFKD